MKILKIIGWFLLIIFIVVQFFQPQKNEGNLTSLEFFIKETIPSNDVHKILKKACFDCHSNTTRYPWYSKITPINFWLSDHINHGKKKLNFSNWSSYSLKKKEHKFEEVWQEIKQKQMPLNSYTWTHADARLSDIEISKMIVWAKTNQKKYKQQLTLE